MSGSTISPPLNADSGVESFRGSTNLSRPCGGRALVMAKITPASPRRSTARTAASVSALSVVRSVPSTSDSTRRIAGRATAGTTRWAR